MRTAVDLLRWCPPQGLAMVDAMRAARGLVLTQTAARRPFAGTPGVTQGAVSRVVVKPLTESPGESWTRLLVDAGFPGTPSAVVPDAGSPWHYRLDMGWR